MKSKSPLMLMEQLLMILVFVLAAAFCLQAFALSERLSLADEQRSQAALQAQNAVEILKACHGDYAEAVSLLGGSWDGQHWTADFDAQWNLSDAKSVYRMTAEPQKSEIAGLGKARVDVCSSDGEVLFSLPAAWQEVSGHG